MAGTVEGGREAARRNKELYGEDFYRRIGAKGGRKGTTGGFHANRDLARLAGAVGGAKSRRGAKGVPVEAKGDSDRQVKKARRELLEYQSKKSIKPYLDMEES